MSDDDETLGETLKRLPQPVRDFVVYCDAADHLHGPTNIETISGQSPGLRIGPLTHMDGDTPYSLDTTVRQIKANATSRQRVEFRCGQCGRSVQFRDVARFKEIVALLISHGAPSASLALLQRMLDQKS